MLYRMPRSGRFCRCCTYALVALAAVLATPGTWGQLTDEDLEALREQGKSEGWTFTVDHNPATQYALEDLCGVVEPVDWWKHGNWDPCLPGRDLPASYDWRDYDGCTPVKNQASCGSCWAFSAVGAVESTIRIQEQIIVDLSEQWLVSCTPSGSCSGGWPGSACNYMLCNGSKDSCGQDGAVLEADFPYVAYDKPCGCPYEHPYCLDDWSYIGSQYGVPGIAQMKQAILDYGPISVCVHVNSAFQAYSDGIFNGCATGSLNHAVVLVGWDDNQGTNGIWIMRNSWSTGWGEDGYMRIPYGCSSIGAGALYVDYHPRQPSLHFAYPQGFPDRVLPGQPRTFQVDVTAWHGTPQPGTGQLHYSLDGQPFESVPMIEIDTDLYEATFPVAGCGSRIEWYISAQEASGGVFYDPENAPLDTYLSPVATSTGIVYWDDFEQDHGWAVGAPDDDATAGVWNRMDPEQTAAQPEDDHSPVPYVYCWVTDGRAGSDVGTYDVDNGKTTLCSPTIDLSDAIDAMVSYWRWYSNDQGGAANEDVFTVDVSSDGGASWQNAETVGPTGPETAGGWYSHTFWLTDYVEPTANIVLRFVAADAGSGSIVEAAIDDVVITKVTCLAPELVGDMNCDGAINGFDIDAFLLVIGGSPPYDDYYGQYPDCNHMNADCNEDGVVNGFDIDAFVLMLAK
ncbi:MAG: hypothetical protein KKB50_12335 [Planctomycetes bacterium]|nr:hypothetical protein [Planctomycetota bacterium]